MIYAGGKLKWYFVSIVLFFTMALLSSSDFDKNHITYAQLIYTLIFTFIGFIIPIVIFYGLIYNFSSNKDSSVKKLIKELLFLIAITVCMVYLKQSVDTLIKWEVYGVSRYSAFPFLYLVLIDYFIDDFLRTLLKSDK